ncbi:MAG: alpha/beta fold hydrolase [Proteobacteria bacterium]|nr:alpha/beta fold hydrolase [Pseudomonadota bacterium]
MNVLRTPDECFVDLPDYPFQPHYTEVEGLRIHHIAEGPVDADSVLLMHGEPTWSFLYRHMIPILVAAGHRAIAPDLVGFGRSDKPAMQADCTYQRHVDWMGGWLETNEFCDITLVRQDWGSLIGLRLAAEHPDRFARIVVANGFLPTGDRPVPLAFRLWRAFARWTPWFPVGRIVSFGCSGTLGRDVIAGYNVPFPDRSFKKGARAFPMLVPARPDDPASPANRRAWEVLRQWKKPLLTAFSDGDPVFRGADRVLQKLVPGAAGQAHTTIQGAGHFLQEDRGRELAEVVVDFIARTQKGEDKP